MLTEPKKTKKAFSLKNMATTAKGVLSQIPSGIWVLGFVSLLMDISSEMIHSLLPLFMVTALGASVLEVGLIEGLAEADLVPDSRTLS
jgi:hypothetical protein